MFNNELMADVHFIVGPPGASKKVPAHKVCADHFWLFNTAVRIALFPCLPTRLPSLLPPPPPQLRLSSNPRSSSHTVQLQGTVQGSLLPPLQLLTFPKCSSYQKPAHSAITDTYY